MCVKATCLILASLLTARGRLFFECLNASFDVVPEFPRLYDLGIQRSTVLSGLVYSVQ